MIVALFVLTVPFQLFLQPVKADVGAPITETQFGDGNNSVTINLLSEITNDSSHIELSKNITLLDARMTLEYDHSDPSPGQIWLDINQDGTQEWVFGGGGNGDLGKQNTFSPSGSTYDILNYNSTNNLSSPIKFPSDATFATSSLNLRFESEFKTGFHSVGEIVDFDKGDLDNDQRDEVGLLSQNSTITGYASAVSWIDWTPSSGLVFKSWVETCTQATELVVADINGDGKEDVATISLSEGQVCIHLYDKMTGTLSSSSNFSLETSAIAVSFSDLNGDNSEDLISLRANQGMDVNFWTGSGFGSTVTTPIYQNNSNGATSATVVNLLVGSLYGPALGEYVLVQDTTNHWTCHQYNQSLHMFLETSAYFDNIQNNAILADIDLDGDLDIIGSKSKATVYIENTGSGWNTEISSAEINLNSAYIFDYNDDDIVDLLTLNPQFSDSNESTINGNYTQRHFYNASNASTPDSLHLIPGTMPQKIIGVDFDEDGKTEHVASVGEINHGLFIGGWHTIGLDVDMDGLDDLSAEGYARNASELMPHLVLQDPDMSMVQLIDNTVRNLPSMPDLYGVGWSQMQLQLNASTNGTFNFTSLEVGYDLSLEIHSNSLPSGNLTNVINQKTSPNNGTFNMTLPFNSTKQGKIVLNQLSLVYILGAEVPIVPPDPVITVLESGHWGNHLQWNEMSNYGPDLIEFQLFRSVNDESMDFEEPYAIIYTNEFNDTTVSTNSEYHYLVLSLHTGGLLSNLSNTISVLVPYPPPPPPIQGVVASDVIEDTGGSLAVSWNPSTSPILAGYHVYIEQFEFTNITELSPHQVNSINTSLTLSGLQDGEAYWVGVTAYDIHGNESTNVVSVGPFYSRNDSLASIDLYLETSPYFSVNEPFWLQTSTSFEGEQTEFGSITVILSQGASSWQILSSTPPNQNLTYSDFSGLGFWAEELYGQIEVNVTFSGFAGDTLTQPFAPKTIIFQKDVMVSANFSVTPSPLLLNITNQGVTQLSLSAYNSQHNPALDGVTFNWTIKNLEGAIEQSGQGVFQSGSAELLVESSGGVLEVTLISPSWLNPSPTTLSVELQSSISPSQPNEWSPESIQPLDFSCPSFEVESNDSVIDDFSCSITNPNNFSIEIAFDLDGWTPYDSIDFIPSISSLNLGENESKSFNISVTFSDLSLLGPGVYTATITGVASAIEYPLTSDLIFNSKILWSILDISEIDDGSDSTENLTAPRISGSTITSVYVAAGAIGIVSGLVWVLVLVLRKKRDNADTWSEDDFDHDIDPESYSAEKRISKPLPVGMSLEEIKYSNEVENDFEAPQNERMSLFDEADGRDDEVDEDVNHEINYKNDDDYEINIDEDGTEWYEDDDGTWWYREEGMDDWEEYHEG